MCMKNKKSEYDDSHEKSAEKVLREIFCPMCVEHESMCRARYDKDDIKKMFYRNDC